MNASYYNNNGFSRRAIHTDFCSSFATDPTWSKLDKQIKNDLFTQGNREWMDLIKTLNPDIIIFSIPKYYRNKLGICTHEFHRISKTKTGEDRKPRIIEKGLFGNSLCIFGTTVNTPFGDISKDQKNELGQLILNEYISTINNGN